MVGLGNEFTVTEVDAEAEQAVDVSVTVTLYPVVEAGDTTMLSAVPPGEDHE
jgi:FKBP-type peptidyl-prolyl cis-trans isomerase (trigger factor)